MRKSDLEVREVVCSETGKPMPKIPLWMADVKVKFVSDEARQKHPVAPGLTEIEPIRRAIGGLDDLKDLEASGVAGDDTEGGFDEEEVEVEELPDEDFEG